MNRLTEAGVYVADQLVATLDTTTRRLELPSGRIVMLVDTVGFVSKLPHELVAAFKGTLEQVVDADLVVHVVDSASHDLAGRRTVVEAILEELGASNRPRLIVYNKSDLGTASPADGLALSAHTGEGLAELRQRLLALAGWHAQPDGVYIARERHVQALRRTQEHLALADEQARSRQPALDLLAEELRLAHNALAEITGAFTPDDLLGEIFSRFCIGK